MNAIVTVVGQDKVGIIAAVCALLAEHNVATDLVTTSESTIALALDSSNATSGEDHRVR